MKKGETPPPREETGKYERSRVREFLEALYLKLKGFCDSAEAKIAKNPSNY